MTKVVSPCTGVCKLDADSGWCKGCLRTMDEIAGWSRLDKDQRRTIMKGLDARRASLKAGKRRR